MVGDSQGPKHRIAVRSGVGVLLQHSALASKRRYLRVAIEPRVIVRARRERTPPQSRFRDVARMRTRTHRRDPPRAGASARPGRVTEARACVHVFVYKLQLLLQIRQLYKCEVKPAYT